MSDQEQTLPLLPSVAEEINRLHSEALSSAAESRNALCTATVVAWRAGQLLLGEKQRVRRAMGPGAWDLWITRHFTGSLRTAQRYMRLAKMVHDVAVLQGMSLRQVYSRLNIATEPKSDKAAMAIAPLPRHTILATRLLGVLKTKPNTLPPELQKSYQQDLLPLYERLRLLFETGSKSR
jgi:hypothetical protein